MRLESLFWLRRRRYPVTAVVTWLLVVFTVLLPKGGVKFGETPLTWGYLVLAATLPVLTVVRLLAFPLRFRVRGLVAFGTLLPFQILFLYAYEANGVLEAGLAVSTVVSLFVLPFAFFLVYPVFLERVDGPALAGLLRGCIFWAAAFGIFLFVSYPLTGKLVEIPYLTVNAADYGLIETTKHINRGVFLKLISTYNNGNLYGVATLILLPLYDRLEGRLWRRNVVRTALLLTLSRTVWAGLIFDQLLSFGHLLVKMASTFPRVRAKEAAQRGSLIVVTMLLVVGVVLSTSGNVAFLFDKDLGGRAGGVVGSLEHISWLPTNAVWGFLEVIYTSALTDYGVLGLLAVVLIFTGPVLLYWSDRNAMRSPLQWAAFKGLVLYIFLAGVDSSLNLIPTMAFYWFTYMIFLEGWPGPVASPARLPGRVAGADLLQTI